MNHDPSRLQVYPLTHTCSLKKNFDQQNKREIYSQSPQIPLEGNGGATQNRTEE